MRPTDFLWPMALLTSTRWIEWSAVLSIYVLDRPLPIAPADNLGQGGA